jgi:ParB family chromosome partitioning protein
LDKIHPADVQPRKHFDQGALEDLASSIKESGLIQPLVVRQVGETYELIAGERRWRASKIAGLLRVPVVVKDVDDAVAFALALIENIQRQDLNPVEEAMAYQRLLEDFELTQAELAEQVGKSRSAIANAVRLLGLPHDVLNYVSHGELSAGHARTLIGLEPGHMESVISEIQSQNLNVRDTEALVKAIKNPEIQDTEAVEPEVSEPDPVKEAGPVWLHETQTRERVSKLSERLSAKVQWRDAHGRGRIEIHYDDYEALQAILAQLGLDE